MENINQDINFESDSEIDNLIDNEQFNKLNYLRKLGELAKFGYKLDKSYSMQDSIIELELAYKFHYETYKQNLIKKEIFIMRNYFLGNENPQYYIDNLWNTGTHFINLFKKDNMEYIVEHDKELWNQLTKLFLYFLRSEIIQKYINIGFEWLESNVEISHLYINASKQNILNSDENTFVKLKKSIMDQNYKFICAIKNDEEIKFETRQQIIKLLIKINSIVAEIKETTSELLEQIDNIFNSDEKIIEFANQTKNFIMTNLECTIKDDVFYYKYIIPRIEQSVLEEKQNKIYK